MNKIDLSHIDLIGSNGSIISNNKGRGAKFKNVYFYSKDKVLLFSFSCAQDAAIFARCCLSAARLWAKFGLKKRGFYWSYNFPYAPDRYDYRYYINKLNSNRKRRNYE